MGEDALRVIYFLFNDIWRLFTSWYIPGTRITPAAWALFALFFVLLLRVVKKSFLDGDDNHD